MTRKGQRIYAEDSNSRNSNYRSSGNASNSNHTGRHILRIDLALLPWVAVAVCRCAARRHFNETGIGRLTWSMKVCGEDRQPLNEI
jgi:hypothetical protein